MAGKVLKMNKMHKINNSAIMNRSAENSATTHTHNRYTALGFRVKLLKTFHRFMRQKVVIERLPFSPFLFR